MVAPGFVVRHMQHLTRRGAGRAWRWPRVFVGMALAAAATLAVSPGEAQAQNWPTKPIKFVVAYPAGGGADFIARLFSERMSKLLEQPIVVENRPGAGGTLGALSVVRAEPDGYTLLIAAISEISIAPATYKALAYDPEKDLVPVVQLASPAPICGFPGGILGENNACRILAFPHHAPVAMPLRIAISSIPITRAPDRPTRASWAVMYCISSA